MVVSIGEGILGGVLKRFPLGSVDLVGDRLGDACGGMRD